VSKPPAPGSPSFFSQAFLVPIHRAYEEGCDLSSLSKRLSVDASAKDTAESIIAKWMPLSVSLIDAVLKFLRTPIATQSVGISHICPSIALPEFSELNAAVCRVDASSSVLAFAPKIVHGGLLRFPAKGRPFPFVAYVRVYSGTIRIGDTLYVGHQKSKAPRQMSIESLYIFMGNELLAMEKAPAGCLIGIGMSTPILKQSTLASIPAMPLFTPVTHYAQPIVKVSLEALALKDQDQLAKGAMLLAKIDPAVVVTDEGNGQLVLSAMGEVHLQYCVDELKDHLAKVEFSVSEPLVPCKETIIDASTNVATSMRATSMEVSCFPLSPQVLEVLQGSPQISDLKDLLANALGELSETIVDSFGMNLLFADKFRNVKNSLSAGFRLCVSAGPLCGEPIYGVGFVVESIGTRQLTLAYLLESDEDSAFAPTAEMPLQFGEAIGCAKEAFRAAVLAASPRILEPVYRCDVQTDFSVIGKTYEVLQQHRCKIGEEKQKEGSISTCISCLLPVIESFGFPGDLCCRTSGKAYPQLMFSHFELVVDDPFWKPQTEEELEYYSVNGKELKPNVAKKIIEYVRKRKGTWEENIEQRSDRRATMGKSK
jgi:translation elongation factor EF-G